MNRQSISRLSPDTLSELKTKAIGWKLLNPAIEQILIYDTLTDVGPDPDPYPYLIIAFGDDIGEFNNDNDLSGTDLYGKTLFLVADTAEMADRLALSHMRDYFDNRYDSDEERFDPDEKLRALPETNIDCLLCEVLVGGKRQTRKSKEVEAKLSENYFYREGNGWLIGFQGEKTIFTDHKYIRYISVLLDAPGSEIAALDLVRIVDGVTVSSETMSKERAIDESLSVDRPYKDEEVSNKKFKQIEKLLADIEREDDPLIKEELQEEYDKMVEKLTMMNVIKDKDDIKARPHKKQKIDDPQQKQAQKKIRKALDTGYAAIQKYGMKKLSQHLKKCIKPAGSYDFVYRPTDNTSWEIKL